MRFRPIMARLGLAILAPILLIALLEGTLLRLDLGYPTSFLRPATVQGQSFQVNNPFYGYRFFHPQWPATPPPAPAGPAQTSRAHPHRRAGRNQQPWVIRPSSSAWPGTGQKS